VAHFTFNLSWDLSFYSLWSNHRYRTNRITPFYGTFRQVVDISTVLKWKQYSLTLIGALVAVLHLSLRAEGDSEFFYQNAPIEFGARLYYFGTERSGSHLHKFSGLMINKSQYYLLNVVSLSTVLLLVFVESELFGSMSLALLAVVVMGMVLEIAN
jgi:hypothetical protein